MKGGEQDRWKGHSALTDLGGGGGEGGFNTNSLKTGEPKKYCSNRECKRMLHKNDIHYLKNLRILHIIWFFGQCFLKRQNDENKELLKKKLNPR